jgi:hypothetical protein
MNKRGINTLAGFNKRIFLKKIFQQPFLLLICIFLFRPSINAQFISLNGAYVSVSSGTVMNADTINNDNTSTLANTGTLNINTITNAGTAQGNGTFNIAKSFVNTGTFSCGSGLVNYNGSGAQSVTALNYYDLTITDNGTRTVTLASSGTTGIAGTFSPTTSNTTYITTGSSIDFNGTGAQSLPSFTYNNITASGGNTKTVAGNFSIYGELSVGANTTFALSSYDVTLKSSSTATARLTSFPATASITYGSGKFIVERYIPGRRKYRLLTSSVTTYSGSSLSPGQEALSIWGNWQNQGGSTANIGTLITGGSSGDGFDQQTTNASLYTYNSATRSFTGFTTANSKNTKYTPLKAGVAYYMFVYGDRLNTVYTNTPNYTTVSSAGTLLTGDQTYNTSSTIPLSNTTGQYTLLGNPFASPIDWALLSRTNLSNTYWGWDPNLNSTGGYVTVSTAGSVTLISPFTGTTGINQYIQPGQGFFVQTTSSSPVLVIHESDKVSNFNPNAFRTTSNSVPLIAVNLFYQNAGTEYLADGALAAFDPAFSNEVNKEDAAKMSNSGESVSIAHGANLLSIDARKMPGDNDTLFLNTARLAKTAYTMQIFSQKMEGATVYLEDKYLRSSFALSMSDTNRIQFNINSDPASSDANRFRIVFNKSDMQQIAIPKRSAPSFKVFPNPVRNGQVQLRLTDIEKGEYTLKLINSQGQEMLRQLIIHDGGNSNIMVAFNKILPKGIYTLQMINNNLSYQQKIFVE